MLLVLGCAEDRPRAFVGALDGDLDAFMKAHPLAPGQGIRADEIARTPGASFHIVQVASEERPHRHVHHDLSVVVLRGRGTLHLEARSLPMRAGDAALVPRDTPHWFAREGRDVAVALVTFVPPLDAPDNVPVGSVDSRTTGG